jgi:hypothetical protein
MKTKGDPDRAREFVRRAASEPLLDQRSAKKIIEDAWGINQAPDPQPILRTTD